MRREYATGRCRDCGRWIRVTEVAFWVNGLRYQVCATCIRAYRKVILKP